MLLPLMRWKVKPPKETNGLYSCHFIEPAHAVAVRLLDLIQYKFNLRLSFRNKFATWGGSRWVYIAESVGGEDSPHTFPWLNLWSKKNEGIHSMWTIFKYR